MLIERSKKNLFRRMDLPLQDRIRRRFAKERVLSVINGI